MAKHLNTWMILSNGRQDKHRVDHFSLKSRNSFHPHCCHRPSCGLLRWRNVPTAMVSILSLGSLYKDLQNRLHPNRPAIFWISRHQKLVVVTIRALKLFDIIAASKCVSFGDLLRARLQLLQLSLLLQCKQHVVHKTTRRVP